MKKIAFIALVFVALSSCSESAKTDQSEETSTEEVAEHAVEPNKMMSMEIDGMVCKMGCGGSIRKSLKETGGVSRVEFDFDEERSTNFATIYFNDSKINKEEIIDVVAKLNDKQFTVGKTEINDFTEVSSDESDNSSGDEDAVKIDAYSQNVEVPNLLELLSGLFL